MSEPIHAKSAFLVLIGQDGSPVVVTENVVPGLDLDEAATQQVVRHACYDILDSLRATDALHMFRAAHE